MAKYTDIKGFTVQTLSTDTVASQFAGGSWASGGDMNEGRVAGAGSGTQTASIFAGGTPPTTADVELYNGSSWTETTELNTGRAELAAATVAPSTAALVFSGHTGTYPTQNPTGAVEYWNGSSWTELAETNTARWAGAGAGAAYTAALFFGGYNPGGNLNSTETWNGSAWTEVNELNTARRYLAGTGSNTAAIAIGGSPSTNSVEQWDGSNWTATTNFPSASEYIEAAGASYTNCLALGVTPSSTGKKTVHWDGSSWTELSDYTTGRINGVGTGSSSAALLSGGNPAPVNASTEEFTAPSDFVQQVEGQLYFNSTTNTFKETITDIPGATWASSGSLNSPRGNAGSSGLQTAALYFGGDGPPGTIAITEQYDGSSWTEVADMNAAKSQSFFSNQGTQTAALSATGYPVSTSVESWNGSSWTETTENNTARRNGSSLGTQGAMLGTGGYDNSSYRTLTEIWDGSSWTETGDCPDAKFVCRGGGGTTTAGIIAGNYPNGDIDSSQTWDGSTWTNGPNINTGRSGIAFSAASQSSALGHGGGSGTPQAAQTKTEFFNGTSWTELNDLATASQQGGGAGSSISGIHYGGYGPGALTTTEEWTAGLGNKTITAS